MSLGRGAVYAASQKQKLNTKSSTKAELLATADVLPQALWTKYFLSCQGYKTNTILFQDNQSAIRLEENGRQSSDKKTRHVNHLLDFPSKYRPIRVPVGVAAFVVRHRCYESNSGVFR